MHFICLLHSHTIKVFPKCWNVRCEENLYQLHLAVIYQRFILRENQFGQIEYFCPIFKLHTTQLAILQQKKKRKWNSLSHTYWVLVVRCTQFIVEGRNLNLNNDAEHSIVRNILTKPDRTTYCHRLFIKILATCFTSTKRLLSIKNF